MKYTTEQEVEDTRRDDTIVMEGQKGADRSSPDDSSTGKSRSIRPLSELNVIDNFMFNELTMQEDKEKSKRFCSILVETLLGRKINNITITPQRPYQGADTDQHGICVDVQIEADSTDGDGVNAEVRQDIYDIEPNCYKKNDARRARYYAALLDNHSLQSGEMYQQIKDIYLLIITTYDPFGEDSMVYTIERHCKEYPDMEYRDGINIMFLYAYGKKNIPNQKVKDMLLFLVETTSENAAGDKDREAIYQMVFDIKNNRKAGAYYMKQVEYWQMLHEEGREEGRGEGREEGREEGRVEGREEGRVEGREEGREEERKLSSKVLKRYNNGKSSKEIAEELNISADTADDIIREYEMA